MNNWRELKVEDIKVDAVTLASSGMLISIKIAQAIARV